MANPNNRAVLLPQLIGLITLSFFLTGCSTLGLTTKHRASTSGTAAYDPGTILATEANNDIPESKLLDQSTGADVVYVGEQHSNPHSHDVQLKLIKHLVKSGRVSSVGFELFREKHQSLLDDWRRGVLPQREFKEKLEASGSNPKVVDYYRDVLRFAQKHELDLVALKPDREAVRRLMKNLHGDNKSSTITDSGPQVRFLEELFRKHPSTGRGFGSFVRVQQFWEDRMAKNIHQHLSDFDKNRSMVVLTGDLHVLYDFGIPDKLKKRGNWSQLSIVTLPADQSLEEAFSYRKQNTKETVKPADYVWWVEASNRPMK